MLQTLDTSPLEMRRLAVTLRMHILKMITSKAKGHTAPALSVVEIMTALYFGVLNLDPENPLHPQRDRFILSKGHACTALYAALAERGFFPRKKLDEYYELDSYLGGHPVKGLPGVEASTGSLGHGLSISMGIALAARLDGKKHRVFTLMGDGEIQEGSVWEAAMAASHYRLDNMVAIVDRNNMELDGPTEEVMALEPLEDKWRSFGWSVRSTDGHNAAEMASVLRSAPFEPQKPSVLLALTVKGKGIDFVENRKEWHHKAPDPQQTEEAFRQLRAQMDAVEKEIGS